MNQEDLKVGDSVRYQPAHYGEDKWENGVVKGFHKHQKHSVFVVYNCNGEWHKYQEYTGALTSLRDLKKGWKTPAPAIGMAPRRTGNEPKLGSNQPQEGDPDERLCTYCGERIPTYREGNYCCNDHKNEDLK